MKRLIKKCKNNWSKEKIDGYCECADCGKKINGIKPYNNHTNEFVCEECYEKAKNDLFYRGNPNVQPAKEYTLFCPGEENQEEEYNKDWQHRRRANLIKKSSDDDDMDFNEIKEETLTSIKNMQNKVNEWSVRDTLKDFTDWGFYKGGAMASIDESLARQICTQLIDYINTLNESNSDILDKIYDKVYRFAMPY